MVKARMSMLSVHHPGQLAQLVGDTAPEMLVGLSQATRRLRLRSQIMIAQIGIGAELSSRRLRQWINVPTFIVLRR